MNTSSAYLCKKLRSSILGHVFTIHKPPYPYQLPKGWEWTTVGDVCDTSLGKMLDRANNEGVLKDYLRNVNVRWSSFDLTNVLKMPFKEIEMEQYQIHKGDLIICEGGEPGRCAIWENDYSIMYQKALHRVRCSKAIFNKYLAILLEYYANSNNLKPYFTGSTIKHLTRESLNSVKVPLPPFKEQQNITAKINQWLAIIGLIEEGKGNLQISIKQAKSKILDLAIHGKLVPQDPNDEPASELLKRINPNAEFICDNPRYGKLPQGWCSCHINDFADSLLGKTLDRSKNTGEPKDYLCTQNVQWGKFDLTTLKQFLLEDDERERYAVKKGDLMVCEGGDVGRSAIWENDTKEIYYQNALHRIRCHNGISNYYILYVLMHNKLKGTIDHMCNGVTIKHFTQTVMNKLDILLPPSEEQIRIVAKVNELFTQLDTIEASL